MTEHWERVVENEFEFYRNFETHKEDLLDYLKENAFIQVPITIFDDELGQLYRFCPGTEVQALRRMEIRERIEASITRAEKRITRLHNSIQQLHKTEQELAYLLLKKNLSDMEMANILGQSLDVFAVQKEKVLKHLYAIYKKERQEANQQRKEAAREAVIRKAALLKNSFMKESSESGISTIGE